MAVCMQCPSARVPRAVGGTPTPTNPIDAWSALDGSPEHGVRVCRPYHLRTHLCPRAGPYTVPLRAGGPSRAACPCSAVGGSGAMRCSAPYTPRSITHEGSSSRNGPQSVVGWGQLSVGSGWLGVGWGFYFDPSFCIRKAYVSEKLWFGRGGGVALGRFVLPRQPTGQSRRVIGERRGGGGMY